MFSDGDPLYVDGAQRVDVAITESDFHFKPVTHRKGTRRLWVSLGEALLPGDVDPFDQEPQELGQLTDFRVHDGLLTIACGQAAVTKGRLSWASGGQGQYHLAFGVDGIDPQNPEDPVGDPLSISRTGTSESSTWTIESSGTGYLRLASVYQGTFNVPFEFTVTGPGC